MMIRTGDLWPASDAANPPALRVPVKLVSSRVKALLKLTTNFELQFAYFANLDLQALVTQEIRERVLRSAVTSMKCRMRAAGLDKISLLSHGALDDCSPLLDDDVLFFYICHPRHLAGIGTSDSSRNWSLVCCASSTERSAFAPAICCSMNHGCLKVCIIDN